ALGFLVHVSSPGLFLRGLIGQPNIIFSQRRACRYGIEQIIELRMLDLLPERAFLRDEVERLRHPPGEPLGLPDALQCLLRIAVDAGTRAFLIVLPQTVEKIADVACSQVQALGPGWRHDVTGVSSQEQTSETKRLGDE